MVESRPMMTFSHLLFSSSSFFTSSFTFFFQYLCLLIIYHATKSLELLSVVAVVSSVFAFCPIGPLFRRQIRNNHIFCFLINDSSELYSHLCSSGNCFYRKYIETIYLFFINFFFFFVKLVWVYLIYRFFHCDDYSSHHG